MQGKNVAVITACLFLSATGLRGSASSEPLILKARLQVDTGSANSLKPQAWRPWGEGFTREGRIFVCDNSGNPRAQRGAGQTVHLNQVQPLPIVAVAWSKAEAVGGTPDNNYALYLDVSYKDGTHLWGQTFRFATGTHDWQRGEVVLIPDKPIRTVSVYLLLRGHTGKAFFRDPVLKELRLPERACFFDGLPVVLKKRGHKGFSARDVAADSDVVAAPLESLGLKLSVKKKEIPGGSLFDVTLCDTTGRDRAVTLYYSCPAPPGAAVTWLRDPYQSIPVEERREYMYTSRFRVGLNGRLSRYPLGAVAAGTRGVCIAIDMTAPAFFRIGYNASSRELFIAYDLGFAPEKPQAHMRFCKFDFKADWGFRSALAHYYKLFPKHFKTRIKRHGLWMPFAPISKVQGWKDFGFRFKEGVGETAWDDAHGILTFRYTEPMTWWMPMPARLPRTLQAALDEARRRADRGDRRALSLFTSGFHDQRGRFTARLLDRPWCNGAVWSMNSMPGIQGEVTDFKLKWNRAIFERYYGSKRHGDLDGEYVDSSEGYVTEDLDFRRDHFKAARTPLCFSLYTRKPGIFKGLIAFEYVKALRGRVHPLGKFMMANGAPGRLCWLVPYLDVLGTETNWNPGGRWQPMSKQELIFRRALCRGKPFCFLMNTRFEHFGPDRVEKYMKRCLAYGMYPGFFSHNASQGHYFRRPELYNRDRKLFKKYVPLCRRVGEAGWEPVPLARTDRPEVLVERFGKRYLTVLNDAPRSCTFTLSVEFDPPRCSVELLTGRILRWQGRKITLSLGPEDVAVIDLKGRPAKAVHTN